MLPGMICKASNRCRGGWCTEGSTETNNQRELTNAPTWTDGISDALYKRVKTGTYTTTHTETVKILVYHHKRHPKWYIK